MEVGDLPFFGLAHSRIHTRGLIATIANTPQVFYQHIGFWVIIHHKIKTELALLSSGINLDVNEVILSKETKDDKVPGHCPFSRLCLRLGRRMPPHLLTRNNLRHRQFGITGCHHHHSH